MSKNREQASWPVSRGLFAQFSSWLIGRSTDKARLAKAFALYHIIVARARQPRFYAEWGVPDTPDGRLEMIGLEAALVIRRLRAEGDAGRVLAQDVFDVMFADVDRNLREQGVGDLSVGKHVKRAAQTFLARCRALDPCLDAGDVEGIAIILDRNIHQRVGPIHPQVGEGSTAHAASPACLQDAAAATPPAAGMLALARHALAEESRLRDVASAELLAGRCELSSGAETPAQHGPA